MFFTLGLPLALVFVMTFVMPSNRLGLWLYIPLNPLWLRVCFGLACGNDFHFVKSTLTVGRNLAFDFGLAST